MKRIIPLLALLMFVGGATPSFAQEPIEGELELVKQLRARGWNDLAKAKIEELLKRNDPALNAILPLELARINISAARQQDPDQRLVTFKTARAQLQDFIAKNQGKADAAIAAVEVVRLTQYHAQAILSKAMREEENKDRHEKARPAETKFIEAGAELNAAIKLLEAAIANPANAGAKSKLERELAQAKFDLATNLFDQAKTYINRGNLTVAAKRGEIITQAIKAFVSLRSEESSEIGWLANAWLMKCSMEIDAPADVQKYYRSVMSRSTEKGIEGAIQPAVRLVRYFHMQDQTLQRPDEPETMGSNHISGDPKKPQAPLDRLRAVQKEGEAWLKAYPNHLKSFEGQGVRYELAHAYFSEAADLEKAKKKDQKAVDELFKKASAHFKILGDYDGELAGRSRDIGTWLESKIISEGKTELRTFDQFFTKGMIERKIVIGISRDPKLDAKKVEEQRKTHLKEAIKAYTKALTLTESKTPLSKIDDARFYLCGAYLAYGDPFRGAIIAESLGRSRANSRGADGASTAIATYSTLQTRFPDDAAIKTRLFDMAEFVLSPEMQKTWSANSVTSLAHYHMGMAANRDNNRKKAIEHLSKIAPDFTDYVYTQGQLVFIAEAGRTGTEDKAEQKWFSAAARAAIKCMPTIDPKNENPSVLAMYLSAKAEDSRYLYMEAFEDLNSKEELKAIKKFNDMKGYLKTLRAELDKVPPHLGGDDFIPNGKISKDRHDQIEFTINVMSKYADLGQAEVRFRSDNKDRFDQVLAATKTVVDNTLAKAKATPADKSIDLKDYRVTSDILSLALRAYVQKGDAAKGKEILDALQRIADEKGIRKSSGVVAVLLNDIAGQIKTLKEKKDASLKTTKENYTVFLDVIAKELEAKGADNNAIVLMAHAYGSLEYPKKSADFFGKYKAPAALGKKLPKGAKFTEEEEAEIGRYWGVQIEHIRALRATKEKESLKQAEDAAKKIIIDPAAKYKIQAMMERNFIAEDLEQYRVAYSEWTKFLKMPSLTKNLDKPEVQKIFFPGYYHATRTLFLTAIRDKDIKDRQKLITGAANNIIKLENSKSKEGWSIAGPMFMELFKDPDYEKLYKEYQRLKGGTKTSSLWERRDPEVTGQRMAYWEPLPGPGPTFEARRDLGRRI